jgi:VanZ family protein
VPIRRKAKRPVERNKQENEQQMDSSIIRPARSPLYKVIRYWVPVVLMVSIMAYFSTDVFSGENTRGVLESILRWFWPHIGNHSINVANHYVRKAAHVTEYSVFAVLVFRAMRADSPLLWKLSWFASSFAVVIVWSLLDELHQAFTRTRGASIYDSMLDSAAGLAALVIVALVSRVRMNSRDKMTAAKTAP